MATYAEIQNFVAEHDGFVPKSCWIADVKEELGLPVRRAWNRRGDRREVPCPAAKREAISRALRALA